MSGRGWLLGLLVLLLAAAAGFTWVRAEGDAPAVEAPTELVVGKLGRELAQHQIVQPAD